jgi:hypothetical protein
MSFLFFQFLSAFGDKQNNKYIDFFFDKLQTEEEKLNFINNFNDSLIINSIKNLLQQFIDFNYNDIKVLEFADTYYIPRQNILKWHRSFHFSVLKEYWNGNETDYFKQLKNNASFQYLLSLEDEKNFNELLAEALKRK